MCLIKGTKDKLTDSIPFFLEYHDISAVGYNLGIIKGASIWCKWLTQTVKFLKKKTVITSNINSDKEYNFNSLLPSYIVYIQQNHSYEGGYRKSAPETNEVNITSKLHYDFLSLMLLCFNNAVRKLKINTQVLK